MNNVMPKKDYSLEQITRLLLEMRDNCIKCKGQAYDDPKRMEKYEALNDAITLINNPSLLEKPMQKPLTLEEIAKNSVVWLEDNDKENIIPAIVGYIVDHEIVLHSAKCSFVSYLDEYGKRWRAWASRPTDEEREAAAWDT